MDNVYADIEQRQARMQQYIIHKQWVAHIDRTKDQERFFQTGNVWLNTSCLYAFHSISFLDKYY